jgi:hypothetical protein
VPYHRRDCEEPFGDRDRLNCATLSSILVVMQFLQPAMLIACWCRGYGALSHRTSVIGGGGSRSGLRLMWPRSATGCYGVRAALPEVAGASPSMMR